MGAVAPLGPATRVCSRQEGWPRRGSKGLGASESLLEGGGVKTANLNFINLSTTTSRVSVRNINESVREGEKQIVSK
jgi:hypothetical protein